MEGVQPCIRENTCISGFLYMHFSLYTEYSGLPRGQGARATCAKFRACMESDQQPRECRSGTCASGTRYFLCRCATRLSVFEFRCGAFTDPLQQPLLRSLYPVKVYILLLPRGIYSIRNRYACVINYTRTGDIYKM